MNMGKLGIKKAVINKLTAVKSTEKDCKSTETIVFKIVSKDELVSTRNSAYQYLIP